MKTFLVFVSWYDKLSIMTVEADESAHAESLVRETMAKLSREFGEYRGWDEETVSNLVKGSTVWDYCAREVKPTDSVDLVERWREPRLPTGCPA